MPEKLRQHLTAQSKQKLAELMEFTSLDSLLNLLADAKTLTNLEKVFIEARRNEKVDCTEYDIILSENYNTGVAEFYENVTSAYRENNDLETITYIPCTPEDFNERLKEMYEKDED